MSIKKIYAERYKMVGALRKLEEEAEAQELMNERMNKWVQLRNYYTAHTLNTLIHTTPINRLDKHSYTHGECTHFLGWRCQIHGIPLVQGVKCR